MLQRGLAILLSVSMLTGGSGNAVYGMESQANVQTVCEIQNESTETLGNGSGDDQGTAFDGTEGEGDTSGNGSGDDQGTTSDGTEGESGASGNGNGDDQGTAPDGSEGEGGTSGNESSDDQGTVPDGSEGEGGTSGNESDDDQGTAPDGSEGEGGTSGNESSDDKGIAPDGTEGDNGTPEDESGADNGTIEDGTDQEDETATDAEDDDVIEVIGEDSLSQNNASVLSVEEDLTLTTGTPQTVTLAEGEKQWLSFTAPEEGFYKFYSTSAEDSYQYKDVVLFHEKTDEYGFDSAYGSNFSIIYQMKAEETVWLSVKFDSSSDSGTFAVHAEKVTPPEFTVTTNSEGSYTLQSAEYRLNLTLTSSYTTVKTAMELRQADGSAFTRGSYQVYFGYSYINKWGSIGGNSSNLSSRNLTSYNDYKEEFSVSGIATGEKFWITELQLRDSNNNILVRFGEGGQEIAVNTKTTEKLGVLTEVTAEDASISVRPEMVSDQGGRVRYRKKNAEEWTYYKDTIYYYETAKVVFAAEPDTDYVVELTSTDSETVYDTAEVRTKAFAAADITAEAIDITSSEAKIKVTVGSYTGSNQYIRTRVSYVDSMGDTQTAAGTLYTDSISNGNNSITLSLSNLKAGTEYKDLEVELDDTDAYSMEYVAYRTKVSFTTKASAITAEQIEVTVTADAEDGTKAVLKTAVKGVTEGSYSYTAKYRVAGSKDWKESKPTSGTLYVGNSYADEKELTSLVGNTGYEVLVLVDGISKEASFTTTAAAVAADVEVKPLMQGVEVKAALTGASGGTYTIETYYYDAERCQWPSSYCIDYDSKRLSADNNWQTTAVFYSGNIRPNAENEWKIKISQSYNDVVYEKYMTLAAVRQEISLTAEDIKCTSARIRGKLVAGDESIQSAYADIYYKETGAAQWNKSYSCFYGYAEGDTVYLDKLKENTAYEVKLASQKYPDDILAQITFRTLQDTRNLSVSVDNCRYTSAQINWMFDSGANVLDSSSYICIHYRKKGDSAWKFVDSAWKSTTASVRKTLTDLEPGTTYEVLAELKDTSNSTAGAGVVKDAKAEFTTAAVDHVLTVTSVTEGIEAVSVPFILQLTKPTGTLENRAKAEVTLTPVNGGDAQSKEVFLNKDNQYQAKLVINNLQPDTKYAVSAELYESDSNIWTSLKQYDLGEVTTKAADAPSSLAISEAELLLNKGASKKLTVTAQPPEATADLIWTSSDSRVAAVSRDGNVTALKAGEADITVTTVGAAADGQEKVSAVCHVTVRDYAIRVKIADESYDSIPAILSKSQKRTLVVYDYAAVNKADAELAGVTWTSSNPHTATVSETGLLEPQNYGRAYIMAKTADDITLKTEDLTVVNEIQGFSITRPQADHNAYAAIQTAEAVYQVAAGETYRVGCVLSPAYTEQGNSSVALESSRFDWSSDNTAVSVSAAASGNLTEIKILQSVSGQVKITAAMKDEEYKDKRFTITLDVLKKPEVESLPATSTCLNYSNRLADVGLPENWQWKEQDTLLYEAGSKTFKARYTETGYYPYETEVLVQAGNFYAGLHAANWSAGKKAYIVKTGTALRVGESMSGNSCNPLLYERTPLAPAEKDAAKVSVSKVGANESYDVTASVKGTYTVSTSYGLKKAAFEKQGGAYVMKAGAKVKDTTASLKFIAVDTAPIQKISFAVAADSPEQVTIAEDGTIEYKITAANADSKQNERVIHLDVTATDMDGNPVESPKIDYKVSDAAVVKLKKVGTDKLVLTIPKDADGLARIVATAKDELGSKTGFAVRVKDYTPRVTTYKITVNENCTYSTQIAQVVLPYDEYGSDQIKEVSLVETNSKDGTDTVAGLRVNHGFTSDSYKKNIYLGIDDKAQIKKRGNLKYYLAIKTQAYGGTVFVPVQIKLETGMPAVTLKQSAKVNVFYTDTTHLTGYDAVSMGLVDVSSSATIESVRWVAGDGSAASANTEFVIDDYYTSFWKNGKNTKKFKIQQHRPVLNSSKKPSDAAAKGTLFVKLSGYTQEIEKPFTIQTVYKKPTLKVADYKVCPALGESTDRQYIYTNAAKTNNWMTRGSSTVWRGFSDILCADEEVEVVENSNVSLRYSGTKNKATKLTLYSDYWYESLTVPVKVKVAKSKVKLSPAAVTLNKTYPTETTQTAAGTNIYNAETGTYVNVSDIGITGANATAQQMLDQSLINIDHLYSYLAVSVNYANAMGNDQFKPGSYKYKLTPYYGDTKLNDLTLTVKIIEKEATVKVKTKGSIDLLKLDWYGNDYDSYNSPVVTVTPTFQNLDSSYLVMNAELCGAYKDLFMIARQYNNGMVDILPKNVNSYGSSKLKAGKGYALSVKYTVKDTYGEGGEMITVMSNTFTIKPKQSVPKVTSSVKQLTLYASAKGPDKGETMYLYVPHDSKKGYYVIESAGGSLDINKDGRTDLYVMTTDTYARDGRATIRVYVLDADAIKAAAKGTAYKIPVTVRCKGSDGVSKNASTTVSVLVKK